MQIRQQRKERCKQLLLRHTAHDVETICFSDEKLFQLEEFHNPQNVRVYAVNILDVPEASRTVQRSQHSGAVMVWAAVSHQGVSPLVIFEDGTRINQEVYRNMVLEPVVKPLTDTMFHGRHWCFQQDSAPAHKAKSNQAWCGVHLPSFISTQEWPSKSPDLNPLDYFVWSRLQAKVNATYHQSRKSLINALQREWAHFPMEELRAAIRQWRPRLSACVKAKGGYFEM
jgi:inhibitor of nuclear factor kappa-B kinase subunit alpha